MKPRRVTQADIAREAGVHRATVSMALKRHPNIPPATRDRILAIAEKLGYEPDPMLSALAVYRSSNRRQSYRGTLAWLVNSNGEMSWKDLRRKPHFADYLKGAKLRAKSYGYEVEVFELNLSLGTARMAGVLKARNILGVLLSPQPQANTSMTFPWEDFSVVTFGYTLSEPHLHTVTATHYRAMLQIMQELRKLGYARIGLVLDTVHDRRTDHNYLAGYLVEELQANSLATIPPLNALYGSLPELAKWIKRYRPEAIVSGNFRILADLASLGYEVPKDIGVACPVLPQPQETLAGIVENSTRIGSVAVDILVQMLQRGERGVPETPMRVHVEGTWIEGTSLRKQ